MVAFPIFLLSVPLPILGPDSRHPLRGLTPSPEHSVTPRRAALSQLCHQGKWSAPQSTSRFFQTKTRSQVTALLSGKSYTEKSEGPETSHLNQGCVEGPISPPPPRRPRHCWGWWSSQNRLLQSYLSPPDPFSSLLSWDSYSYARVASRFMKLGGEGVKGELLL